MPRLNVLELDVFYRDEGIGPAVVLGHSSTASSGQWRALFAGLAGRYRLIAPDHVGYGRTAGYTNGTPLIEQELAVIEALMNTVDEPVHLVGHSYGGALVARTAVRTPSRVRSLTLIEPTLFHVLACTEKTAAHQEIWDQAQRSIHYVDAGDPDQAARGFIDYWTGPGAYDAMEERARASVAASMPKVRNEWPTAFDAQGATPEMLASLSMPIQLVAGSDTTTAARGVIEALRGLWPDAAYTVIPGAGHMSPLTHAQRVNEVIEQFLDRQTSRS